MANVDKDAIKQNNDNMKKHIDDLKKNLQSIKDAKNKIDELGEKALSYDGIKLQDTYEETYNSPTEGEIKIKKHFRARVKLDQQEDGSVTRDFANLIQKIEDGIKVLIDFTDNIVPSALEDIDDNKDDVEDELRDTGGGGGGGGGGGSKSKTSKATADIDTRFKEPNTATNTNTPNSATNTNTPNSATNTNTPNSATNTNTTTPTQNNSSSSNNPTSTNNSHSSTDTSSDNPTPTATVPTASHSGGGSSTSHTYYEPTEEETNATSSNLFDDLSSGEKSPEDLADSIINKGISKIIPKSSETKNVQHGSAVIPIASGLTAAAAAGLGGKAIIDRNSNKDNEDDEEQDVEKNNSYNDEHQELEAVDNNKKDDKSWLYGMGVGLSTVGSSGNSNQDDDELEE